MEWPFAKEINSFFFQLSLLHAFIKRPLSAHWRAGAGMQMTPRPKGREIA